MLEIDFEWQRDEAGYVLAPPDADEWTSLRADALERQLGLTPILGGSPSTSEPQEARRRRAGERIVRRGGKLVTHRPLELVNGLYRVFAVAARTKEGLLDFVNRFGPLTPRCHFSEGEDIRHGLIWCRFINDLLHRSPEQQVEYFRSRGPEGLRCTSANLSIVASQMIGRPQISIRINSLDSALLLELGQAISSGRNVRQCGLCRTWFEVGPGTSRREDAKFCSDEHRIAYHNSEKKRKKLESKTEMD